MRKARIKVTDHTAVYHCITRIVGGEYLLDDQAKDPKDYRYGGYGEAVFDRAEILKVLRAGGVIDCGQALRLRIRYFGDGLVLGSEEYVNTIFREFRSHFGPKRQTAAPKLGLYVPILCRICDIEWGRQGGLLSLTPLDNARIFIADPHLGQQGGADS